MKKRRQPKQPKRTARWYREEILQLKKELAYEKKHAEKAREGAEEIRKEQVDRINEKDRAISTLKADCERRGTKNIELEKELRAFKLAFSGVGEAFIKLSEA